MQNVGSQKSAHTDELNLDLARDPTSLSSIPDAADATAVTHSEPEVHPKLKTRSRFTSALRKLAKSKHKKEQAKQELSKQLQGTAAEKLISSGTEKPAESVAGTTSEQPKKQSSSKLTRRFILGSLRKSENSSKKSAVAAADVEVEQTKHAAEQSSKSGTAATVGGDAEFGSKIEQAQAAAADSDYLTPSIEASATNTAKESAAALKEGKKKKLKSKKNPSGGRSTQTQKSVPPPADAAAASTQITTTPAEEKFVITRSARDTPPPERAPAKPSRAATSFRGDSSQTRDAAATTTFIAQPPLAQESSSSSSSSKQQRATTIAFSESTATGLMQQQASQGTLQRGHRFPNPKATTTFSSSDSGNATPSTTATTTSSTTSAAAAATSAKSSTAQQQRQLQFQLQSHASPPSHSVPPTATVKQEQQPLQQLKSNAPPTAGTPLAKPATRSPAHRRQHSESASLPVHTADDSVYYTHSSGPDDAISSAESAYPSDSHLASGNNIQNPQLSGHALSQDSQNASHSASTNASTIRFAIGSAVRPAGASFDSLHDQLSIDSDRSTDSQSPISESSRKRIRYLAQPTLFDEFESLQRRRETLKYQTGVASEAVSLEFDDDASAGGKHSSMPAFGDLTMDQEMEPAVMTSSSSEKREHLYKILVIGELGTGKTSFIKRYVHQFFSQNYRATIGVDFALKVLHWDKDTVVRLQLWDIAGQERFGNMTRVYYKEAVGAFIVFDVTRSGTFECVSKWKEDLDSKVQLPDGSPIPCILLANKCDQDKQGLVTSPEKMDDYVKENGFAGWFETSAKENINIDESARALVNKILLNDKLISAADIADSEKFNLNNSSEDQTSRESKNKCSC